jgi:mRNA-degrading endonuclease RelE of RelBE toxin-antitoxin system
MDYAMKYNKWYRLRNGDYTLRYSVEETKK